MSTYSETNILRVSLTNKTIHQDPLPAELISQYIGGRGLGVKLLYDNLSPGLDPLSPDNWLIFAVGPVASTPVPTSGRSVVITKSPLNHISLKQ